MHGLYRHAYAGAGRAGGAVHHFTEVFLAVVVAGNGQVAYLEVSDGYISLVGVETGVAAGDKVVAAGFLRLHPGFGRVLLVVVVGRKAEIRFRKGLLPHEFGERFPVVLPSDQFIVGAGAWRGVKAVVDAVDVTVVQGNKDVVRPAVDVAHLYVHPLAQYLAAELFGGDSYGGEGVGDPVEKGEGKGVWFFPVRCVSTVQVGSGFVYDEYLSAGGVFVHFLHPAQGGDVGCFIDAQLLQQFQPAEVYGHQGGGG